MCLFYGIHVDSFQRGRHHPHYFLVFWKILQGVYQCPFCHSGAPERKAPPHYAALRVTTLRPPCLHDLSSKFLLEKPSLEAAIANVQAWPARLRHLPLGQRTPGQRPFGSPLALRRRIWFRTCRSWQCLRMQLFNRTNNHLFWSWRTLLVRTHAWVRDGTSTLWFARRRPMACNIEKTFCDPPYFRSRVEQAVVDGRRMQMVVWVV